MDYKRYYNNYINRINTLLSKVNPDLIKYSIDLIKKKIKSQGTIYILGNGGSSSIASHVSVDFIKSAKIRSNTFNDSNLITCFANDYGHDYWMKEAIKSFCNKKDLVILISSSGMSKNIINAANFCKKNKFDLITLSGFSKKNKLIKLGKINFHIKSKSYNDIEMAHHIILVSIVDYFSKNNI